MSRLIRSGDSRSLWNCSLSPGWSREEVQILRLAVMKFGVGRWKEITESGCLPGKTPSQLSLQCQRLMGQQSLGEYMAIHLDPEVIFRKNQKKQNVTRKNGCVINIGKNETPDERQLKIKSNLLKYALSKEEIDSIQLVDRSSDFEIIKEEKRQRLRQLYWRLENLQNEYVTRHGHKHIAQPLKEDSLALSDPLTTPPSPLPSAPTVTSIPTTTTIPTATTTTTSCHTDCSAVLSINKTNGRRNTVSSNGTHSSSNPAVTVRGTKLRISLSEIHSISQHHTNVNSSHNLPLSTDTTLNNIDNTVVNSKPKRLRRNSTNNNNNNNNSTTITTSSSMIANGKNGHSSSSNGSNEKISIASSVSRNAPQVYTRPVRAVVQRRDLRETEASVAAYHVTTPTTKTTRKKTQERVSPPIAKTTSLATYLSNQNKTFICTFSKKNRMLSFKRVDKLSPLVEKQRKKRRKYLRKLERIRMEHESTKAQFIINQTYIANLNLYKRLNDRVDESNVDDMTSNSNGSESHQITTPNDTSSVKHMPNHMFRNIKLVTTPVQLNYSECNNYPNFDSDHRNNNINGISKTTEWRQTSLLPAKRRYKYANDNAPRTKRAKYYSSDDSGAENEELGVDDDYIP